VTEKRKLIEVALPLEAINRESAREKSIRHGHPSTLHLWWARRPLAACRAVLFALLVDDPSSDTTRFPTVEAQRKERERLFGIIEQLIKWENASDRKVLAAAEAEIRASVGDDLPTIVDPFAGGGAIPIEAQRLGLPTRASDLNPVAVLINEALVVVPQRWARRKPVSAGHGGKLDLPAPSATGLADDVKHYAGWMLSEARERLNDVYPMAMLADGSRAHVISWIWMRAVECPNPGCRRRSPIARSFWLSKNKGKEAWLRPVVLDDSIEFEIEVAPLGPETDGNMNRSGAICLGCGTVATLDYLKKEGLAGRISEQLVAVVAEGQRRRIYLQPDEDQVKAAQVERPADYPSGQLASNPRYMLPPGYGLADFSDLFTNRQLHAVCTFSDLVDEAVEVVRKDAVSAGWSESDATSYSRDIALYLAFFVSKLADIGNSLCAWEPLAQCPRHLFGRQAIPMVWDFAEGNPIGRSSGSWEVLIENTIRSFSSPVFPRVDGLVVDVRQLDATSEAAIPEMAIVSTDPPYYDNVPYSDISDFFYVWMRKTLRRSRPELTATLLTPKAQELVADPVRHGGKQEAREFFESGFMSFCRNVRARAHPNFPVSLFYAFKQAEGAREEGVVASTGWETMLEGLVRSGFVIDGTWPIRTEMGSRMRGQSSNALASSVVLACRQRPEQASLASRKEFVSSLRDELPSALRTLQEGSVAPVDLAQAAIGPGMAAFSRYSKVVEADGSAMSVRTALGLINQVLDETLAEQEADFDGDTRWAVAWFEQHGMNPGPFGVAETLSKAKNTAINGLVAAGILESKAGKVRLLDRAELPHTWDPTADSRLTVWELTQHLIRALALGGENEAADLLRRIGGLGETARELTYRLYVICERKKWAKEALAYNALVVAWPEISRLAAAALAPVAPEQQELL
jgi:putative DNA methylase